MMTAKKVRIRSRRSPIASGAKTRDMSQRTATSGMKNPAHTVDDSTTSPTTAGTKTNRNRRRAKGRKRKIYTNTPGIRKLMLQIVTYSTRW
jgi:hypothetical protein